MGMTSPVAEEGAGQGTPAPATWLIDELGRERLRDMGGRGRTLRTLTFVLQLAGLLGCGPWLGWWPPAPLIAVGVVFAVCDRAVPRSATPEVPFLIAWVS